MIHLSQEPTPERVQAIAQQTLISLQQQDRFLASLLTDRNALHREIAECIEMVCAAEPRLYTESQISGLVAKLSGVIEALERYFAKHGNTGDVAQCYFLGHAIHRLKDARDWIAQGLSPTPSKRPTPAERERMADEIAREAFNALNA